MSALLDTTLQSIAAELEKGVAPWRQPWANGQCPTLPKRADGQSFSGMNAVMLATFQATRGYGTPFWLTFNQALDAGGCVRKGEKASPAILYKTCVIDDNGDAAAADHQHFCDRRRPQGGGDQGGANQDHGGDDAARDGKVLRFLRAYAVFNAEQIDGLPDTYYASSACPVIEPLHGDVASIMARFPVPVVHGGNAACYYPQFDRIHMPPRPSFETDEDYVATLLHEFAHATGHKSRLDRFNAETSREDYAREELVAELTSLLTAMHLGINPSQSVFLNHVSYLASWGRVLKDRPTELLKAAGKAQAACDYILNYREAGVEACEAGSVATQISGGAGGSAFVGLGTFRG